MKVYNLGTNGRATAAVQYALGLPPGQTQVNVMVCARSKAAAYATLAACNLAPGNINDKEFRVDNSTPTQQLLAAGVFTEGTVAVTRHISANTPVVWVEADGNIGTCGEFVRGQFVPDADLVAGGGLPQAEAIGTETPAATGVTQDAETTLAMLVGDHHRIGQLERELVERRASRNELIRVALDDLHVSADGIAAELGVGASRVYQLRDKALLAKAEAGQWLPGMQVQVEDPAAEPVNYPRGVVVERPAGWQDPDSTGTWVWVKYHAGGDVVPVRERRLMVARPACTLCPPDQQPTLHGAGALSVHYLARHGVR